MGDENGLIVRRYQRFDLVLPTSISVAPEHQNLVRFSPSICERDGWISATLTDVSPGGLGFIVETYVPRQVLLRVRISGLEGGEEGEVLDVKVRVQRVQMTDRRPAFLIGTAYADLTESQRSTITTLTRRLAGQDAA